MTDCKNCGHAQNLHFPWCIDPYVPGKCNYGYDLCGCREYKYGGLDASQAKASTVAQEKGSISRMEEQTENQEGTPKFYRTCVTLKLLTYDTVEVQAAAALYTRYISLVDIPTEYYEPLQEHEEIWTFCQATIGAEYPELLRFKDWETDEWSTKEQIDEFARTLFKPSQDKTPQEVLDIVDDWLHEHSPDNVQMFSWQVVYAETWARIKAWRDKQ